MNWKATATAVVVLVAVGVGAAFITGVGPMSSGDGGSDVTDFPTETGTPTEGASGNSTGDGAPTEESTESTAAESTESRPPFTFTIDKIEKCGRTCRDVTSTLFNNQDEAARNVNVYTRIYAGNQTNEDDIVWEGTEDVGTMEPSSSYTTTKRVELSFSDAMAVRSEDGWITVVTTVQSDETTVTFEERRNVT